MSLNIENGVLISVAPAARVEIPEGVREIGERAFRKCQGVTSVTLPEGLEKIGKGAFMFCEKLTEVKIPESVTYIGAEAFSGCRGLVEITIPAGVTVIPRGCFADCRALVAAYIPRTVREICDKAFGGCSELVCLDIPEGARVADSAFDNPNIINPSTHPMFNRCYLCDNSARGADAISVKINGIWTTFREAAVDGDLRRSLLESASHFRIEVTYTYSVDRTGSDYEFCYDDENETQTYRVRLYPENCLVRSGRVIGFVYKRIALLLTSPNYAKTVETPMGRNKTEVTSHKYKLVKA